MATATVSKKRASVSSRKGLLKVLSGLIAALFIAAPSVAHSQFGIGFSPILTGSMRPYAYPGDLFVSKTTKASNLKVGDIILVTSQSTGVFYSHRIISITGGNGSLRIITKGDANAAPEETPFSVGTNELIPRSIARVKWIGRPLVYISSVQGRQAALALIVIANVIALVLFLFRKKPIEVNPLSGTVYKDLYAEEQAAREKSERELNLFKELYAESQISPSKRKAEMAEVLLNMKSHTTTKTKSH
jgi:signal peptidase